MTVNEVLCNAYEPRFNNLLEHLEKMESRAKCNRHSFLVLRDLPRKEIRPATKNGIQMRTLK